MKKRKTTILFALCMAAFGLLAPSMASAASLQREDGTLLLPGEALILQAPNGLAIETEWFGTFECETVEVNTEVITNNDETVELLDTPGSYAEGCSIEGEIPIDLGELELRPVLLDGSTGTGTTDLRFAMRLPGGMTCKFQGSGLEVNYEPGSSAVSISGALAHPSCGEISVEGTFSLASEWPAGPVFVF